MARDCTYMTRAQLDAALERCREVRDQSIGESNRLKKELSDAKEMVQGQADRILGLEKEVSNEEGARYAFQSAFNSVLEKLVTNLSKT